MLVQSFSRNYQILKNIFFWQALYPRNVRYMIKKLYPRTCIPYGTRTHFRRLRHTTTNLPNTFYGCLTWIQVLRFFFIFGIGDISNDVVFRIPTFFDTLSCSWDSSLKTNIICRNTWILSRLYSESRVNLGIVVSTSRWIFCVRDLGIFFFLYKLPQKHTLDSESFSGQSFSASEPREKVCQVIYLVSTPNRFQSMDHS